MVKSKKAPKNYYKQIDDAIKCYENYTYAPFSYSWICDRIDWCWKFRHITEAQMEELINRIVAVMDMDTLVNGR